MRIQFLVVIFFLPILIFSQTTRIYDMEVPAPHNVYGVGLYLYGDNGYELNFYDLSPGDEFWDCSFSCGSYYQLGNMLYMKDSIREFEMEFEVISDSSLIARKAFVNMVDKTFQLNSILNHTRYFNCPLTLADDLVLSSNHDEYGQKKYVSLPPEGCYGLSSEEFAINLYYINHRYEFVFHEVIISEGEWIIKNGEIVFKDAVLSGNFTGVFFSRGLEVNILATKLFFVNALFPDRNR